LRKWAWINSVLLLVGLAGCRQEPPKTGVIQVEVGAHLQERPAVVSFGMEPQGKQLPDNWRYKASYTRNGRTARFGIEFLMAKTTAGRVDLHFGNGSFIADAKSRNDDLLQDLKTVLKAGAAPSSEIRVRQLPFRFIVEGESLNRGNNGDLIDAATGNWVKARIFLGPQQDQEVFLNFQKPGGTGEFAISDPAFGNGVLRELAKVL
jgi:hypothetical protein